MTTYAGLLSAQGGPVHRASDRMRLDRFLICGSSKGTYYASAAETTLDNAEVVTRLLKEDPISTINRAIAVNVKNIAPKVDPSLIVAAMATLSTDPDTRALGWAAFNDMTRIGTHLFHFLGYRQALDGKLKMNRRARRSIGKWYNDHDPRALAYELTKYKQRDGISHRDVIRLAHVNPKDSAYEQMLQYALGKEDWDIIEDYHPNWLIYLRGVEEAQRAPSAQAVANLIRNYNLPREVIPTEMLNEKVVWEALLEKMPLHAMIRNLPKMTVLGLFNDNHWRDHVYAKLTDQDSVRRSRVHPMAILLASSQYGKGRGDRGSLTWTPNTRIQGALSDAFMLAFANVEPTNKRICLAVDTSGSMTQATSVGLSSREIGAAMALITASIEPDVHLVGFSTHLSPLPIKPGMRLDQVTTNVLEMSANATYCRLPIEHALKTKDEFAAFVMYTDGQTSDGAGYDRWGWSANPARTKITSTFHDTLSRYRQEVSPAKFIMVAAAANNVSLSDPEDPLSLDIAGFGSDVPAVISAFVSV